MRLYVVKSGYSNGTVRYVAEWSLIVSGIIIVQLFNTCLSKGNITGSSKALPRVGSVIIFVKDSEGNSYRLGDRHLDHQL